MFYLVIIYFIASGLINYFHADDTLIIFDGKQQEKTLKRFQDKVAKARFKITRRIAQKRLDGYIESMDEVQGARNFFSDESMKSLIHFVKVLMFFFAPILYLKNKLEFVNDFIIFSFEEIVAKIKEK